MLILLFSIKKSIHTSAPFKYNNYILSAQLTAFKLKILSVSQKVFSLRDGW